MANPTLLTMPLCIDADKNTIPPTDAGISGLFSEQYGWQDINSLPLASGGKAPNRRDFNGVFALLGGIAYACQRGYTFEWVATLDYEVGCVVLDTNDNKRYECIADVSANATPPNADTTHWRVHGKSDSFKVGDMKVVAYNDVIEDGWLLCDGSAPSRSTYAELFAKIGTTYGVGDGTTTFNLPNFIGRVVQGAAVAGAYKEAGLPNIKGKLLTRYSQKNPGINGVVANVEGTAFMHGDECAVSTDIKSFIGSAIITLSASASNPIYGNSDTVQPPALTCRVLIKYE